MRRAILVCRVWASIGTPILWRCVTTRSLERIANPARRQLLASHVQTLHAGMRVTNQGDFGADDDAFVHGLHLPRLKHVHFRDADWNGVTHRPICIQGFFSLAPYLQLCLTSLECRAKALTADAAAAELLVAQCRMLRELRLVRLYCACPDDGLADSEDMSSEPGSHVIPVDDDCRRLLSLLERLPDLTSIGLVDSRLGPCNGDLLMNLAARPALVTLQTSDVTRAQLRRVWGHLTQPFSALQRLHMHIHSSALRLLVAAVPRLTELTLSFFTVFDPACSDIDDYERLAAPPQLGFIAALSQLRSLGLSFPEGTRLTRAFVQTALAKLPAG